MISTSVWFHFCYGWFPPPPAPLICAVKTQEKSLLEISPVPTNGSHMVQIGLAKTFQNWFPERSLGFAPYREYFFFTYLELVRILISSLLTFIHPIVLFHWSLWYCSVFSVFVFFLNYFWLPWVLVAAQAFPSCSEQGLLFIVVRGLLIAVDSLVAKHGLSVHGLQ